ncbi:hypothetical protein [Mesorhizobium sp. LNJC403B00]|uniref:hypothetical protein n=1 Tax=Mesorhizobium sp. LNJC403B00 TaxID=1287280 RepID=UPI0003CF0D8B|nr:hypothetical protein [Mesorhizobium sp. LNJC403B00]ESX86266.1 hypothetical protein X754_28875 [Mesorhizobium sp. LNJC403B00]
MSAPIVAATSNLAAIAQDSEADSSADLLFILSQDEGSVVVRRVPPKDSPISRYDDWTLDATAFGPKAWFDLDPREYAQWDTRTQALKTDDGVLRRLLTVREASWGRHVQDARGQQLEVTFVFERIGTEHWSVGIETNVWSSATGNPVVHTENANRKPLHSFIADRDKSILAEILSKGRIESALGPMFDGQVSVSGDMKVGLNANLDWILQSINADDRAITAFDGCVEGPDAHGGNEELPFLTFRWEQRVGEGVAAAGRRLTAHCPARWTSAFRLTANGEAPSVSITPNGSQEQSFTAAGDFFVGQLDPVSRVVSEGGVDSASVIALFSTPSAVLDCYLRGGAEKVGPLCVGVPLDDVTFTRIVTGSARDQWRDVVVADAGGKRTATPASEEARPSGEEPKAAPPLAELVRVATTIGRMDVAALPVDTAALINQPDETASEALKALRKFDAVSAAAIGDRAGVSERTFFLLVDRPGGSGLSKASGEGSDILRRLYADVALYSLDAALPDTRDSTLAVAGSHFRFNYSDGGKLPGLVLPEVAWNTPDGHLWVGELTVPGEFAWLDLGGSTLCARRDHDLVDVRFRFADFVLGFSVGWDMNGEPRGIESALRPSDSAPRQTYVQGPDLIGGAKRDRNVEKHDTRPILAVEFPPQHVMEEAFFRQSPGPLPDTDWPKDEGTLETFLHKLRLEPDEAKRTTERKRIGIKKVALEAKLSGTEDAKPFAALRDVLFNDATLPADEREYFGPYAMGLKAIKVARDWQTTQLEESLQKIVAGMLARASDVQPAGITSWRMETLLQAEADAEKVYPLYKLWRDAFRAYVIEIAIPAGATPDQATPEKMLGQTEYVNRLRKPVPGEDVLPPPKLEADFTQRFYKQISGSEPYDRLAMARLSGRSLLAFSVNFEAAPGDSGEVNGLPAYPTDNPNAPGPGVQRFGAMPFTFAALTDWSRHEPYVTQRASKLYEPLASGVLPPVAGRVASVDDQAILVQQGFDRGAKSSEMHLGQVRASLATRPHGLETQIEIPSRLILSTAQNAIWQSPRKVSRSRTEGGEADVFDTDPVLPDDERDYEAYEPLWTARLITGDAEPGLRAVWSPDMRPEAVGVVRSSEAGVPRVAGAPPRGPWAPWILRREQVDGVRLSPLVVGTLIKANTPTDPTALAATPEPPPTNESVCPDPKFEELLGRNRTPSMFERICEIFRIRTLYNNQPDLHTFRTSLDAYDRHELVLLSSAYGLPVTGRRRQIGSNDTDAGELVEKSGQFEPGNDFHLTDATSDLAYYRPKPLDVSELSLSALGGFLNHDTNFLPPAPAVTYDGRSLFDGLSIERWQHLIVLGRDVLATVVYSGYLFPIGHKASLVKITERIFVRMKGDGAKDPDFGIKAVLRQRIFVRVSTPSKKFPAVGQPNKGRQWCSENVTMLTRETPDIVDPTLELTTSPTKVSLSGRIFLDDQPGLAFWPQTAMTDEARFRFEFLLDGRRSKMPLIFVDRIAAKNKTSLNALLRYYRDLDEEKGRTALLGGQTLRFAESVKEGDTSFSTDRIVLSVDGRASGDGSWEGRNDLMTNTGVLEGADQPPFYPALSSADIRLEQAENMSGAGIGRVKVRFDGSYVRGGFPPRQAAEPQSKAAKQDGAEQQANQARADNAAEVFLYVDMATPPKMSMGPNGNQSGGVGRPNMDIVALSRSKGILGAQPGQAIYQSDPTQPPIAHEIRKPLSSVAKYFSLPAPAPAQQAQQNAGPAAAPAVDNAPNTSVFESFFSADAKLLGVISFQQLMKLMKLAGGVDAMPALKEAVDYGSQMLDQVEKGAAGALDLLRNEVLAPLLQLVREARKEWSKLDGRQVGAQQSAIDQLKGVFPGFQTTSLRTLYPEIDRGLKNLETALLDAMGETDALAILGRLAAVHEAGRQFMRELARLAANPVERIEQAARAQFDNVATDIQKQIRAYEGAAADFVVKLKAAGLQLSAELKTYLLDQLPWDEIEALRRTSASGEAMFDLATKTLGELRTVDVSFEKVLADLASGKTDPASALKAIAATFLDAAIVAATKTEAGLRDPSLSEWFKNLFNGYTSGDRAAVADAVKTYHERLRVAKDKIDTWISDKVVDAPEWAEWVARVRALRQLIASVQELLGSKNPARVFELLVQIGRDYLGVDVKLSSAEIEAQIKAQEAELKAWITTILGRLVAVASGTIAADAKINPQLPAPVVASCIAHRPVDDKDEAASVAQQIGQLSPQHFLTDLAKNAADTFDIGDGLAEADVKLKADNGTKVFQDAVADIAKALRIYRELFCDVAAVVGQAQRAHAELTELLQGQGTPPVVTPQAMGKALDRLRILAQEIQDGLRRIRVNVQEIFDLLADNLDVIAQAAAVASFSNDLKALLSSWDVTAASSLRLAMDTMFRWTGVVATAALPEGQAALAFCARQVRERIPRQLDPQREKLAASIAILSEAIGKSAGSIAALKLPPPAANETVAQLLEAELPNAVKVKDLLSARGSIARTDDVEEALQALSASYAALVDRATGLPASLVGLLNQPVAALLVTLSDAYHQVLLARNAIVEKADKFPALRKALLIQPLFTTCDPLAPGCDDKLTEESKALAALAGKTEPMTKLRAELQAFCDSIAGGRSAVETIFDNIQAIWDDISRGDLASLVDIAALRDQVEELISKLIPVKRTLRYDLNFDFDGDKIAKLTGGVFIPKTPSRFELGMVATIDLLKAKADMKASGRIGPFNIQLLGGVFDAVTLIFDGVDFEFKQGGSPRFDVHYRDFQIGKKLEFVKKLQSYMSPSKDGSGFFIEAMRGSPGIVAGYGINLGTIQLGGVAFSNVLLNAAAELPFDGEAALFRFALGRTLAPFLISVPPYGGGGFVAIYADAQGFRGFEASFEFGGVADFSTGPLVAQGRLTSGFYIRSMKVKVNDQFRTLTDIYGTFFVGGEASIWIFSFYASLYVRLGMKSGGEMEGEATFTFSFSMGIVDYDFTVTVTHKQAAFGGGGTNSISNGSALGDDVPSDDVDRSIITRSTPKVVPPGKSSVPNVLADTTSFGTATVAEYLAYFDKTLLVPETSQ